MKVLHLISNLMSGGAESMLTKVVEATPDIEHSVISFISGGLFAERLQARGVAVHSLGLAPGQAARAVPQFPKLRRLVREMAPDVLQGWMYHGNLAASAAAGGRPVLWNIRQRLERLGDNRATTQAIILGALAYRASVRQIIYNSESAAREHERFGYPAGKRYLIPNGFDLALFRPDPAARDGLRTELGLPPESLLVGRVARDDAIKDTPNLLAAFARLDRTEARLVLVGRGMGADNPTLAGLLAGAGLAGRVHLLGERDDIPRLVAGLDLFALSSSHGEAFPNAVGEAMAVGTPVVTTNAGECAEIVGDPSRIAPVRDAGALAGAIDRVLALSPEARRALGARDRQRIEERYSLETVAARYAALWRQVAGR